MTSRGSPDSTIRPQRVREPSRTRWLCTAAVASRIGIGQRVSSAPRSESTRIVCCVRTSREACLQSSSSARSRPLAPRARVEQALERADPEAVGRQRAQLLEVARQQHRLRHRDAPGVLGRLVEQVPLRADRGAQAHHERLALRVDGRVRDLGEVLLEVGRQQLRALGERRERRVDPHRADRLLPVRRHRRDHEAQVLAAVAEEALQPLELGGLGRRRLEIGQVLEVDLLRVEQRPVGAPCRRARA